MNLLIVTGLSGAGKSLAMHALEDIGFFCIDNIPAGIFAKLMEFAQQSENPLERMAVVLDIRGGRSAEDILGALTQLQKLQVAYKILFWMRVTTCWSGAIGRHAAAIPSALRQMSLRARRSCASALF